MTKEELVKKSNEKFGNRFSFMKVKTIPTNRDIIITCNIHGDFMCTAKRHLTSDITGGCPCCATTKKSRKQRDKYVKSKIKEISELQYIHKNGVSGAIYGNGRIESFEDYIDNR